MSDVEQNKRVVVDYYQTAFAGNPELRRPLPNIAKLQKPTPALKSIVTHPPKLNARPTKGPAPGAL